MKKGKNLERGLFNADVNSLRKKDGRCFLKLYIYDLNKYINIDIFDEICEAMGVIHLSSDFLKTLIRTFPAEMRVSNYSGFWKIENLSQILSDALIKNL